MRVTPGESGKESEERRCGTSADERDAAWRRPPSLARRVEAGRASRCVTALERCPASPFGPFLAGNPAGLNMPPSHSEMAFK